MQNSPFCFLLILKSSASLFEWMVQGSASSLGKLELEFLSQVLNVEALQGYLWQRLKINKNYNINNISSLQGANPVSIFYLYSTATLQGNLG